MKKEITSREDIVALVDRFYDKVKSDKLLAPVFSHVDWPKHLPIMYSFWSSMLLGEQSYVGNPFQKHMGLPIDSLHFRQWLVLFNATVSQYFEGAVAEEALSRAATIAAVFQHRLGLGTDRP